MGNNIVFTKISSSIKEAEIIYKDNSKEVVEACQDSQWNHDTSTLHRSETNGAAEKPSAVVKEGTVIALVLSGLPEEMWNASVTCTTRWPMARKYSGRGMARRLMDHQFPLEHWLSTSNYRERQVKSTSGWKENA